MVDFARKSQARREIDEVVRQARTFHGPSDELPFDQMRKERGEVRITVGMLVLSEVVCVFDHDARLRGGDGSEQLDE